MEAKSAVVHTVGRHGSVTQLLGKRGRYGSLDDAAR